MAEYFAWLVLIGGSAALATAFFLKVRTARENKFERAANVFYERIQPLIEDDDAPEAALDLLYFLNGQITNKSAARRLFLALLRRRGEPQAPAAYKMSTELNAYYFENRKELGKRFGEACAAAIFAVSYQSPLFGLLVRRLVIFDVSRHKDRAAELAASLHARNIAEQHEHCPVAA